MFAIVALCAWLAPARAFAQTVTFTTTAVYRTYPDGSAAPTRIVNGTQQGISRDDCLKDVTFNFPLVLTGLPTSSSLQVWAGADNCQTTGEITGTNPTCWPVYPTNVAQSSTVIAQVRVQDLVSQLGSSTKNLTYTAADSSVCDNGLGSGETTVNVNFIWLDGSSNPVSASTPYPIQVKLLGPGAPTGVTAEGIDGALSVSWSASSTEPDLAGYHVFVEASGASPADAGTTTVCPDGGFTDGGTDDAGNPVVVPVDAGCYQQPVTTASCSASGDGGTLDTTGLSPMATAAGATNVSAQVTGLTNGTSYAVAVAAYDTFGNDGDVSSAVCATPQPVDDFWKKYRQAGGTAGGGFCALEVVGGPAGAPVMVLGMVGIAIAFVRRRRRA